LSGLNTIFFAADTRRLAQTAAECFRILLHEFLAPRPAELKDAIASRLRTMRSSPALRLALIISPARRASLFSSARSAEENVSVCLRPSAANTTIFHLFADFVVLSSPSAIT